MNEELKKVMEIAEVWTREPFDAETRAQVKAMMEAEDTVTQVTSTLSYKISMNSETREFRLSFNGNVIYEGIEDNVSIMRLFKCMSIAYDLDELTEPLNLSPEE